MDPLIALAALAGGGIVWLVMTVSQLRREVTDLRQRPAATPASGETQRLDHRAQMLSAATLVKLAARDNLDALLRLSPDMADDVLRELAPHLFFDREEKIK